MTRSRLRHLVFPAAIALALIAAPAAQARCADANVEPDVLGPARAADVAVCLVNVERTKRGMAKLRKNKRLRKAATKYAHTMVDRQFFDHVSPGGSTPYARIKATGYLAHANGWAVGENLAWGTGSLATPANIVKAWMKSPGHRENILRREYRELGMGVAVGAPVDDSYGDGGGTYVTSFGRRG